METEIEISDLSRGGSGVAREPSGRVIFVPFTAPGDRVRVRIVDQKKHFAQAELLEVLVPSPLRQKAPCPVFGRCGGCQWQHLPYEFQWKTKLGGVRYALARVQIQPEIVVEELPAERIWRYRNRIQLRGNGGEIGFYAPRSHDLIPIETCEIARDELNALLPEIREKGVKMRNYKIEIEVNEGKTIQHWNARHAAAGFRQVHDEQNLKLQAWVKSAVRARHIVLDLYGGSGNLARPLASQVDEIHCVDVSAPAENPTPDARIRFHRSSVLKWLLNEARAKRTYLGATAIFDPPREGLLEDFREIATAVSRLQVKEIIAIGCDTDSWARDLSKWLRSGWKIDRIAALDLFPQTPHVEALARLFFDS